MTRIKFSVPPLLPLFLSLASGIIAGNFLPSFKWQAFGGGFVLAALLLPVYVFDLVLDRPFFFIFPKVRKTLCLFFFFLTGYLLISYLVFPVLKDNHVSHFTDQGKFWITGRVVSAPERSGRKKKTILKVKRLGKEVQTSFGVTGRIRLSIYKGKTSGQRAVHYGDRIRFRAALKSPHNFNNPGGFDYKKYLLRQKISATAYTSGNRIFFLEQNPGQSRIDIWVSGIEAYRRVFSRFIFDTIKDPNTAGVLSALVTGRRDLIDKKVYDAFAKTGVVHVLAISGLHLSIVASLFYFLFNKLFSLFPYLLIRGWSGRWAAVLTLVPLLFYAFLSGFSPSTKRAFIMISVFMTSFAVKRETDAINSLACAGILILLYDPGALFSISFQLSFTAVLFIILGLRAVKNIAFLRDRKTGSALVLFFFVSICATCGTLPLVIYYFNLISFAGIFANFFVVPALGFIAVPLGLAGLFIYPFSMAAASFFLKTAGFFVSLTLGFVAGTADLPFTWTRWVTPDGFEIMGYYGLVAAVLFFVHHHKKTGLFFLSAALVVLVVRESIWTARRFFNENPSVTVLDVGQGFSAFIELPQGKRILVDGGGFSYVSRFDTGAHIVAPFLWKKKVKTLDAVILTHPEADHMNGLVFILDNFRVKKFIKNSDKRGTAAYKDLMNIAAVRHIKVATAGIMAPELSMNHAELYFYHPFPEKNLLMDSDNLNNNSIVFKLKFKTLSVLFPGDIMEETEAKLASLPGSPLASDILISPHHGSMTSSSDIFLDRVSPKVVIIPCGWHNRFGFPHESVLKRYKRRNISVYRTDLSGAVQIVYKGHTFKIKEQISN
ncbi:MAG: DNA internalization-related competence protein ComEC/Rec2 [Thermodesulfobacteriota bacterium]|nr:DNA internalization-related competence protein ComEC/Rec2 [Thermodesulfobacteriota bacterium]